MSSRSCLSWQQASQAPQQLVQQNDASVVGQGRIFYTEDRRKPEANVIFIHSRKRPLDQRVARCTLGRHCEEIRCWSSQQKRGGEATSRQTGHSSSFSRDSIKLLYSDSSSRLSDCASLLGLPVSPSWTLISVISFSSPFFVSSISAAASSRKSQAFPSCA